jgi:histidinol-phosphate aminotransferase
VFEHLLRAGLIVRPVAGYGLPQFLRISVGTPEHTERLFAALRGALA